MAHGHRAVVPEQQQRHGLAHDVGAPQHHTVPARRGNAVFPQQLHDAEGGAGPADRVAHHHFAHIPGMEAVHILGRVNGPENGPLVDMAGQRQLHQNAVHGGVGVQPLDAGQQLLLGGFGGQAASQVQDAALVTVLFLAPDIDLGGGVFPHQEHRQAGAAGQGGGLCRHLALDLLGKRLAV